MTPEQAAKSGSESGEQRGFFVWLLKFSPQLESVTFAIPNGGSRGNTKQDRQIRGGILKAEGVKAGVPDIMVAWPYRDHSGLFIEMKREGVKKGVKGVVADKQSLWAAKLTDRGYKVAVAYNWQQAAQAVRDYFNVVQPNAQNQRGDQGSL